MGRVMSPTARDVEQTSAAISQQSRRDELDALAASFGYHVYRTEERSCYSVDAAWPLWIQAKVNTDGDCVLYGVVRCRGQAGCRTDLNDWVSALWAINLRMWHVCSPFLVDEGGFCSPAERAARLLLFDQSDVSTFRPGENDGDVAMLFMTTRRACWLISQLWQAAGIDRKDQFDYGLASLPNSFRQAFGSERDMDVCGTRSGTIAYYRRYSEDTSFTDFSSCASWPEVRNMVGSLGAATGESLSAQLVRTERVRNAIPRRDQRRIERLVRCLEPGAKPTIASFPCESHLLCVTENGILARRVNCGADRYAAEFINLQEISQANNSFLGRDASFSWSPQISPARFEEMIHSLLDQDPKVQRVKQVGHSNEPDGGRDCIAEVTQSFLHQGTSENERERISRIIVQCKVSLKNVGKGSVLDIRDTVDRHNAQGFLLVSFPGVTRPLVDYIESIRRRNLFWIESWTKADIEARLRTNLSCARRYPDLVKVSGSTVHDGFEGKA
jgi:hypothetical protein